MVEVLESILSIIILLGLVFLGYIAITKKTLGEFWEEVKEMFSSTEEIDTR